MVADKPLDNIGEGNITRVSGESTVTVCNKYSFLITTGDIVKAVVVAGRKAGTYVGRVAVRATGSFNIKTEVATLQGIGWRHCRLLHKADGYSYA
ncbi:hypothetical protein [Geoalkalibacter subterraneus]|uniref:HNH endonuclease n=1 Tax=Geoalkalibacter subterraneus TaxID=483547 RepID=A0A0B5FVI1_9BACT|nr:hypothetical protein [Geoalkalibacter subterraneus]AJF08180.1 hypothetical protein GSUB_16930 [Geoalkalibacter subterraneus]